jgi:hypothetical protein
LKGTKQAARELAIPALFVRWDGMPGTKFKSKANKTGMDFRGCPCGTVHNAISPGIVGNWCYFKKCCYNQLASVFLHQGTALVSRVEAGHDDIESDG